MDGWHIIQEFGVDVDVGHQSKFDQLPIIIKFLLTTLRMSSQFLEETLRFECPPNWPQLIRFGASRGCTVPDACLHRGDMVKGTGQLPKLCQQSAHMFCHIQGEDHAWTNVYTVVPSAVFGFPSLFVF